MPRFRGRLTTPASASTCIGRSAPPSVPIATSTVTCARAVSTKPRFLRAFLRELEHWAALAPGRTVTSIFFGGGTPSLMSADTVGAVLDTIGKLWAVEPGAEITLEANPSSVEAARFRGYRAAGVNRVSLGVQSLDDAQLRALGRLHTSAEARAAIGVAASTFERFSFDLIYARPGQTIDAWRAELAPGAPTRGQASVALPAHHRAGHAVCGVACARQACRSRWRRGQYPL